MTEERWATVDEYLESLLAPDDSALQNALKSSAEAGLPPIQVSPMQGKLLYLLARSSKARRILEIGTLGAYSTICLARGLEAGGRLITLEFEPLHAKVAQANIRAAGVDAVVELRQGRALDLLPILAAEQTGPFDLIFIDADKVNTSSYFQWALKLSRPAQSLLPITSFAKARLPMLRAMTRPSRPCNNFFPCWALNGGSARRCFRRLEPRAMTVSRWRWCFRNHLGQHLHSHHLSRTIPNTSAMARSCPSVG